MTKLIGRARQFFMRLGILMFRTIIKTNGLGVGSWDVQLTGRIILHKIQELPLTSYTCWNHLQIVHPILVKKRFPNGVRGELAVYCQEHVQYSMHLPNSLFLFHKQTAGQL